jgi:membrane-associated phospholipid phosphatase
MKGLTRLGLPLALLALSLLLGLAVNAGWTVAVDRALGGAWAMRVETGGASSITFWRAISWIGGGTQRYIIVGILALFIGWKLRWQAGLAVAATSVLSNLASDGLKLAFARPRPDLVPHLDHAASFAFPSGHATSAAVVYLIVALIVPTERRGLWLGTAATLALLTGLSRIMLGVHWPSDVVGGWLLGASFALAGAILIKPKGN